MTVDSTQAMISLLLPSRGRRDSLVRFLDSVLLTVSRPELLEIVVRLDFDDVHTYQGLGAIFEREFPSYPQKFSYVGPGDSLLGDRDGSGMLVFAGERGQGNLSQMWNEAYEKSHGYILGHMGDDVVYRTPGWDEIVRGAFASYPDGVLFAHGDDKGQPTTFGTHGFITRTWADTVGYFVPPYFASDYNDTWLNDVANSLDRRRFVPIVTEHMHFAWGKGEVDQTHQERLQRHQRDDVKAIYDSKAVDRQRDIHLLQGVIASHI